LGSFGLFGEDKISIPGGDLVGFWQLESWFKFATWTRFGNNEINLNPAYVSSDQALAKSNNLLANFKAINSSSQNVARSLSRRLLVDC